MSKEFIKSPKTLKVTPSKIDYLQCGCLHRSIWEKMEPEDDSTDPCYGIVKDLPGTKTTSRSNSYEN